LSQKTVTVAEIGDYSRQCGQAFSQPMARQVSRSYAQRLTPGTKY